MELDVLGVTPKKKKQFESSGIYSVEDLLQYLPRAYRDYRSITGILPHDQVSVLFGTVVSCERRAGNGRQFVTATCRIEPQNLELTVRWFNMHWIYQEIKSLAERHGKVIIAGKADFDSKVAADQEKYAENAGSYATAANGSTTLYWTPAGVRRVKQILIKFKDEDSKAISDAQAKVTSANGSIEAAQLVVDDEAADTEAKEAAKTSLETAKAELEAAQAELDAAKKAAYANIDADADTVVEALANGEDWAKLAEEKNEDPGMKSGAPNAERGYAVAAGMTNFDAAFVDAALALEKVGDVSGKVASDAYGYYIIKYESDVPEGAIALDSVKDSIHDALLSSAQDQVYDTTVAEWVEAAGVKENLGGLN